MKKAFGQTVRDLKREVNKKVLKVPSIEQKVLDATSNEPWGPHGSHLADIAQASRNYHEYQMIMAVIWKRINDTGKNWRHVYKALTVLEYLVTYGSERVIEDIREHAYQISTLSDFQYIDSSGRDQGSNVRKKSQSLVILVNDKERIQEVRQKAAANRDKYRNTSMGSMYRPGLDRYDDDRHEGHYGSRDEDQNGYGREKEWGYRDDDKYGRYGDLCGRDGVRYYGRDYDDRYSQDRYRDDDSKGQSRSVEEYQYGSRSRSSDKDRDQAYEDDGQYSRGNNARAEDYSQDGSSGHWHDHKFSEQNLDAPPSYAEARSEARSPVNSERDGETSMSSAARSFSPPVSANSNQTPAVPATMAAPAPPSASSPSTAHGPTVGSLPSQAPSPHPASNMEVGGFDEFDPRVSFKAIPTPAPAASGGSEMDLLGSLSDSFSLNALAIIPVGLATSEADALTNSSSGPSVVKISSASTAHNLAFDDPFGDGPFQAIPSTDIPIQAQNVALNSSYSTIANQSSELTPTLDQEFRNTLPGTTYTAPSSSSLPTPSTNQQFLHQDLSSPTQETDILADILPPTGASPSSMSQPSFPDAMGQPSMTGFSAQVGQQPLPGSVFPSHVGQPVSQTGFQSQTGQPVSLAGFPSQPGQAGPLVSFRVQVNQSGVHNSYPAQTSQYLVEVPGQVGQSASQPGFIPQSSQPLSATSVPSQINMSETGFPASGSQSAHTNLYGNFQPQSQYAAPVAPQMASQIHTGTAGQNNSTNLLPQSGSTGLISSQMALQSPQLRLITTPASQSGVSGSPGPLSTATKQANDKFETKSAIWADALNRALVNLNISGSKTNPLADIGVDFDAINRKEKRMEKPTTAPVTSNITMGKAMGSGSGIGRAGASALWSPPNPMMGSGMGAGPGAGIGMGGYGGHPMGGGMGMNMGMVMNMSRGAGMNMGMNQGVRMQQPTGSTMPGGYNPMMGAGGYGRQPYGGY